MSKADVVQVGAHLRTMLGAPGLNVAVPSPGQTPQVRVGELTIGTIDLDEDRDFIVTLVVLRDELPTKG